LFYIAEHYQEGIRINANKCGLFLKFSSVEKHLFSVQQPILFTPKLCMLNCALLCDSSLLISAKDKKSEVFSYFMKVKCEFLARSHTVSLNKGLLNTSLHLC